MEDTLKAFIRENRNQMDIHEPSDLWSAISLQLATPATISPKKLSWLKKGFFGAGASVVVLASAYLLTHKDETPAMISSKTEVQAVEIPVKQAGETALPVSPAAETVNQQANELKSENAFVPVTPFPEESAALPLPVVEATPAPEVPQPVEAALPAAAGYFSKDSLSSKKDTVFNGINKIEVEGGFFDVFVKAHAEPTVLFYEEHTVSAKGLHSKISKYRVVTEKKDSTLKVYIDCGSDKGIIIVGSLSVSGMIALTVPEGIEVSVHNVSGNVKLGGLKGKKVGISTSSGDINTQDLNSTISLESVSGDIKNSNSNGTLSMSSSSGNQYVENVNGNFKTQSVSGDLHVSNVKGDATISSSSGNQVLIGISGTIHASAVSGDIIVTDCNGDLFLNTSSGDLVGKNNRLNGASTLQSVSGDIKMNFSNDAKDISYDLQSVSGGLYVQNGNEALKNEKRLLLKQGPVMIKATTSSGDQRFK
jgi:DUF4097 and DUF4098 domain-containing protein YvlB